MAFHRGPAFTQMTPYARIDEHGAVLIDTFPKERRTADFHIGTNDPAELTRLRRHKLANHYRSLDPSNSFNPGIGHTSKCAHWEETAKR